MIYNDYSRNTIGRIFNFLCIVFGVYIASVFIFNSMVNLNNGQELGNNIVTEFKRIGMPDDFEVNNFNLIRKIGGGRTLTTRFYTTGSIEVVKKHYQESLAKSGWIASGKEGIYTKGDLELKISFFNNYWSIDIYPR